MDGFLDTAWNFIETFLSNAVIFLDTVFSPLEIFGPGFVIFFLTVLLVCITRVIATFYVTKRYIRLEKEFHHWKNVRDEAMKHIDREKGKALAKNIDQAQLNKAYYDYFFEGLLKHFLVNVLPIILTASYIISVYTPEALLERFGDKWIFSFSVGASSQVNISSLLWFVICLTVSFVLFAVVKKVYKKRYIQNEPA